MNTEIAIEASLTLLHLMRNHDEPGAAEPGPSDPLRQLAGATAPTTVVAAPPVTTTKPGGQGVPMIGPVAT